MELATFERNGPLADANASGDIDRNVTEETDGDPSLALAGALRAKERPWVETSVKEKPTSEEKHALQNGLESGRHDATYNGAPATEPAAAGKDAAEVAEDEAVEYFCGAGPWHPPWLQRLRDARVFTFLLCLFSAVEGALVSGLTAVVLSTIERRYRLSSIQTGALASMTDVAVVASVIFISYIGGRGHKPRWLGIALIVEAIGAFVFSLPQFVFGRYEAGASSDKDTETCGDGIDFSSNCASSNNAALFFFMVGNILIGVGAAPLFTIGTSYIDEIVHPKYVSIHLGVFYMMAIIGPALGFGLGGLFLSVYVDPSVDTHLSPSDPGWVGAWWLCYIFCGILCLIISIPFFFYPRLLPNSHDIRLLRESEMALKGRPTKKKKDTGDRWSMLRAFPLELKKIVTNRSWLFVTLGLGLASVTISGFASFGVKYVENQFGLTTSEASIITGLRTIPTAGAGVITSGLLIFFFKIRGRKLPLMGLITTCLAVLTVFGFLIHCPTPDLAGVIVPYADGSEGASDTRSLSANCTASCNCTSSVFDPVCGPGNIIYFSPCHAGCSPPYNNLTGLEQCTCIAEQLLSTTITTSGSNSTSTQPGPTFTDLLQFNSTVSEGLCPEEDCQWRLQLYLIISAFTLFLVFMLQIPNITITIRCVAEDQRTLALGLQSSIIRLIGFVPGPILFGVVFDSACLFWQRDCGRRGNCWVYDNTTLSVRAVILAVLAMMCYIVFITLCWLFYPRQQQQQQQQEPSDSSTATSDGALDDKDETIKDDPMAKLKSALKKASVKIKTVISRKTNVDSE